jgi:predicted DNA-binding transcriptional regulator YafY
MLTDDEAVAVVLGLTAGERLGLFAAESAATASALAKIRRVLPPALARRVAAVLSNLEFTAAGRTGTTPAAAVLLEIADAAEQRRTVTIDYASWGRQRSRRALDVYGLVFHSGRWYVTGHDHSSDEVRTFRLDRVASVAQEAGSYEVQAGFDAPARVLEGIAAVGWRHEVVVRLHMTMDEARRRLPRSLGTLTETPDGVRLSARAEHLDGMARFLAGLGCPMSVERPDELRTELAALASLLNEAADPVQRSRS